MVCCRSLFSVLVDNPARVGRNRPTGPGVTSLGSCAGTGSYDYQA